MKSSLGSILILLASLLALWMLVFGRGGAPPPEQAGFGARPVAVTLARVELGTVEETVELIGDVVTARQSRIGFRRPGEVVEVLVDLGDAVSRGQVLARLEQSVLLEEQAAAGAALAVAVEDAAFAQREARRSREVGDDLISEAERDRKDYEAAAAALRQEQRQAELRRIEAEVANGRLVAPFDGVVVARHLSEGSYAGLGTPVFDLVDLGRREARIEVPALYAADLPAHAPVSLRCDALPGLHLELQIDQLVAVADPASRNFTAVVRLADGADGAGRLLPGMFVRARLTRRTAAASLVVPADCLRQTDAGYELIALGPPGEMGLPTARPVSVAMTARGDGRAAVRLIGDQGLTAGDQVVQTGLDLVGPGSLLAPSPRPDAPDGAEG